MTKSKNYQILEKSLDMNFMLLIVSVVYFVLFAFYNRLEGDLKGLMYELILQMPSFGIAISIISMIIIFFSLYKKEGNKK